MKVVRKITYEQPDGPAAEENLRRQISKSLPEGTHHLATDITVEHLEGPRFVGRTMEPHGLDELDEDKI